MLSMYRKIFMPAVILISAALLLIMPRVWMPIRPASIFTQDFVQGRVEKVLSEDLTPDPILQNRFRGTQQLEVRLLDGVYKGQVHEVYNTLSSLHHTRAVAGMKALFTVRTENGKQHVWLYNQKRDGYLYILAGIFCGLLLLLGRWQGFRSIVALLFTGAVIVTVLIPCLFAGFSPVPISILLAGLITAVSFLLIGGFSRKTTAAIIGTIFGIGLAGAISLVTGYAAQLSGINMSGGEQLLNIARDYRLRLDGLLFTSILIASLGAVMDVSMSIASAMQEIYAADKSVSKKALFLSGLAVSKDVTGTMSNTLILAFTGSSLPTIMMIWGYGMSYRQFTNIPLIVIELMHGLAGSIGIIAAAPFTAAVAVFLLTEKTSVQKP
ncbi:YibE/F family protein [Treponema phagedenis]|nr:YibE/F family protein [Treponema phagedenis]QEK02927.1 YibE/F family protein [Treponema phagedenis]QEK07107.1 YibE/F family protein [Treponema phagedenis]QEK08555.1 YibE/F family protein [Treponema phagedenis]QSH95632.1 YibE/F family protein [Treponema phagedenis]